MRKSSKHHAGTVSDVRLETCDIVVHVKQEEFLVN